MLFLLVELGTQLSLEQILHQHSNGLDALLLDPHVLVETESNEKSSNEVPLWDGPTQILIDHNYQSLDEEIDHFVRSLEGVLLGRC